MDIRDALQRRATLAIQDDILRALGLITITRQNDSNLLYRSIWCLIAVSVTVGIKVQCNLARLLWRHGRG